MYQDIDTETRGPVRWILVDRQENSNAARIQTMRELCSAIDDAGEDPEVRAIVLGHRGKHFIAGADFSMLEDLAKMTTVQVRDEIYTHFQGAARRLHLSPKPTVAAIRGAAITVGCELAIACDFRLVTSSAMFHESWSRMGLIAPLGGLKALPALVGYGRAKEMMLLGREVRGEEAAQIGLATRLLDADGFDEAVQAFALELAAKPPLSYAAAKEGLRRGMETSFDEGWALNLLAQNMLIGSDDYREGVAAAVERRSPVYKGR